MTTDENSRVLRFSMRGLLAMVTAACVILAIPGGHLLLATIALWTLLGAAIVGALMFFQAPIYRLLAGKKDRRS